MAAYAARLNGRFGEAFASLKEPKQYEVINKVTGVEYTSEDLKDTKNMVDYREKTKTVTSRNMKMEDDLLRLYRDVKGQVTPALKTSLEEHPDYRDIGDKQCPIKLLKPIQSQIWSSGQPILHLRNDPLLTS